MKLYISGPVSGMPGLNKDAFNSAERALASLGYEVTNPIKNGVPDDAPWIDHMRADIAMMMQNKCDGVAMLPGWEASKGAWAEVELARSLGLLVKPYARWL